MATLHVTYSCTDADFIDISGDVRQAVGRIATIHGFFDVFDVATCDGASHRWSAEVFPGSGKFAGGKSVTVAFSVACGTFDRAEGVAEQKVQLSAARK